MNLFLFRHAEAEEAAADAAGELLQLRVQRALAAGVRQRLRHRHSSCS